MTIRAERGAADEQRSPFSPRETRENPRRRTRATRPASEYSNSPWPKYGWLVQHAMIGSDRIIYQAMESLKPVMLPGQQGRLLVNASITRIAKATAAFTHDGRPMPRRTVAHRLQAMRAKRIFVEWNADARAKNSPVGLSWRLVPFDSILEDWKNDAQIATPKNRAFWFIGKARHIMTPTEAAAWMLKADVAERNPAAHAGAIPLGEAAADAITAAAAAGETVPLDFEPLNDALVDVSGRGDAGDAQFIWTEVVRASGRHALPPVDAVAQLVREMGATRRKIGQRAAARSRRDQAEDRRVSRRLAAPPVEGTRGATESAAMGARGSRQPDRRMDPRS